jgi:uncharacterized protein (TIRG00374 family)
VRLNRALRIAAAVILTAAVLWRAGPTAVWHASRDADPGWIGIALLLVVVDRTLMAYRWVALLRPIPAAARPPLGDVLRVFFVSTYLGTFLPGSVGGDAVRTYALNRLHVPAADAFASVFLDRLLGVVSLFVMAVLALGLARSLAHDRFVLVALAATAGLCAVAAGMIFSRRAAAFGETMVARVPSARARRAGSAIVGGLQRYAVERRILAGVLLLSIAVQVLRVLQAWCLGVALGIAAPLTTYFAFIPVILLVMLLPISVNGLGTSQVAFVLLFGRVGVASGQAFALSLLYLALGVVGNLPGGLLYAFAPADERGAS